MFRQSIYGVVGRALLWSVVLVPIWCVWSGRQVLSMGVWGVVSISGALTVAELVRWRGQLRFFSRGWWNVFLYVPWMWMQMFMSAVKVAAQMWFPRLRIDPCFARLPAQEMSVALKALYAHSITLTPGTVTVDCEQEHLLIHALWSASAHSLEEAVMAEYIQRLFGARA